MSGKTRPPTESPSQVRRRLRRERAAAYAKEYPGTMPSLPWARKPHTRTPQPPAGVRAAQGATNLASRRKRYAGLVRAGGTTTRGVVVEDVRVGIPIPRWHRRRKVKKGGAE